jgi:hypothetical protein
VKDLGLAEKPREGDMLGIGDALLGEHQHEMTHPGIM